MGEVKNSTIGITGAFGFVGTHLSHYLQAKNLTSIPFTGDLLNEKDVAAFFENNAIDTVIHLAGSFYGDLKELTEKNVYTTQNLLTIGEKYNVKKIIYASTGAVYGEAIERPSKEADICMPNTEYGLTKLFAEDLIRLHTMRYDLTAIILRFPPLYGDGNTQGVIASFLHDIKQKGVLAVADTGEQKRQFLHVLDACAALDQALEYAQSDVFNVPGETYSINEVVSLLQQYFSFTITHKGKDNLLMNLLLDAKKSKEKLSFSPKYTLRDFFSKQK